MGEVVVRRRLGARENAELHNDQPRDHDEARAKQLEGSIPPDRLKEVRADVSAQLKSIELGHIGGEVKQKAEKNVEGVKPDEVLKKPDKVDEPASPVGRHTDAWNRAGKSMGVGLTDDETSETMQRISEGTTEGLGRAAENIGYTVVREGSLKLTPGQERDVADTALSGTGEELIRNEVNVPDGIKNELSSLLSGDLHKLKSSAETTADVRDIESDIVGIQDKIESAKRGLRTAKSRLNELGLPENEQDNILGDVVREMMETKSDDPGLTQIELIRAAGQAAKKMALITGEKVKVDDILDGASRAIVEDTGNVFADEMFRELLINHKVEKNPDLVAWIENLFSEEEKTKMKAA